MKSNSMTHDTQQGSPEWLQLRRGRITGTTLKQVMGKDSSKLIYEMIAEPYEKEGNYQSDAMALGNLHEPWAIEAYEKETGSKVESVGFITKGEMLGLSPDGMVGKTKAIEVKSPGLAKHIEYIVKNKLPSEYKWQVVMYFIIIDGLQELDFVSYHPKYHKEVHIINITRESLTEDIMNAQEKLEKFIEKYNQTVMKLL